MKKIFTLVCAAAALVASAATPRQQLEQGMLRSAIPTPASKSIAKSLAKAEPEHNWVAMGEGTMVDDITNSYYDTTPEALTVDVQMDAANPGWYRIVNPWKNFTQMESVHMYGGLLTQSDDVTIVIDASNPDYVRILETNIGMDDGYGPSTIVGFTELVGVNLGIGGDITQEQADAMAGKLADGVISFTQRRALMLHQGTDYYNCNGEGKFSLALPNVETPVDYTISPLLSSMFCPSADGKYHLSFQGDERIAGVKYICSPEYPEGNDAINATIARLNDEGLVAAINTEIAIDYADATGSEYFVFFSPVGADGKLVEDVPYYIAFWLPDTDTEGWTSVGNATMTEGFVSCVLPTIFEVESYQVEVQRNIANPGIFRIVNPYNPWTQGQAYLADHDHNHYIYFNAENPDNVYIMESGLGLSIGNLGEAGIGSLYYNMVRQYGIDFLTMFDIYSGGTIANDVLSFDGTGEIQIYFGGLGKWNYTNLKENPDFVEGTSPEEERYLGGDFKLDMSTLDLSGINDITADDADAPAVYYNLQGVRVNNPRPGTLYIMRRGNSATKVMIR